MLGMNADIGDAISRAQNAEEGDDIGVSVDVNRDKVRSYVAKLDDRFGIPAENAVVTGLVNGRPQIADSKWGREVRRQTMVRAIVRTLRTRIRPALPLVTKTLKPSVSKTGFGPVIVINRGANSSSSSTARRRCAASAWRPAGRSTRLRPAASGSSTCRRTRGGARPTPTGRRA